MQNHSARGVSTSAPAGHQASGEARESLFRAIDDLEQAVGAWLTTPAAWDQRTHPSIRQFLVDIREYSDALQRGGKVSPNIIVAAADRLAGKVHHPEVDRCAAEVRAALAEYVRVLHG
ncbi:hypothetical protein J2X54_004839 [Duganella sp. 3397]|uniref:Uncharacterized protein n=1 Tax=Duganella phyllosphaerae TaxID=762836 RepID=A0A1E7WL19_9BURK|nr:MULTISPECIES: hypothetical protein [Duganella]MDR7052334.1 hypothetical protein [Duganella sp. 3397]OEZ99669.1 hypothetical protein DUPY_27140 [Duganella phyllosphaerae]